MPKQFVTQYALVDVVTALADVDMEPIADAIRAIDACRKEGGTVYVCGNGGSMATAMHFACDMAKTPQGYAGTPAKTVCLGTNPSLLTAMTNDDGYDGVFARDLHSHGVKKRDVLVAISASGNSENVLFACEAAKDYGPATVIGLTGFDGGALWPRGPAPIATSLPKPADIGIHVPSHSYR